jgi:hypothetical protein
MNYSDFYNAPTYRDASCPSQCMSENTYLPLTGRDECSMNERGDYTSPFADKNTPSYCNFMDNYSRVGNIYAPSTIYIPPESAARIYNYPIGVNSDFMVTQPQIVNWNAQTEFNNLTSSPIIQDPTALMQQIEKDVNEIENMAAKLQALREQVAEIARMADSAQGTEKITLANQAIALEKQALDISNDLKRKVSGVKTSSQNAAPYTVRSMEKQGKLDSLVQRVMMLQKGSNQASLAISSNANLLKKFAKNLATALSTPEVISTLKAPTSLSTSPNAPTGIQKIESFARLRRRGY